MLPQFLSQRAEILAVALGGALGAVVRYAFSGWVVKKFPAGTLLVNVVGCLLIGLLVELLHERRLAVSEVMRLFLIAGFLGSLTTFSTFGYQSVHLMLEQDYRTATLNVLANLVVGFAAVWAGLALGRLFAGSG